MKTKNAISLTLITTVLMMISACGFSQKTKELKILTSAQCGMCKERIEGAFAYEPGVKKTDLNLNDKVLTITYNPSKIDENKIRQIINKLGYDADNTQADPIAYEKLPACCKKPGTPGSAPH